MANTPASRVEVHLKNAKFNDIDEQAHKLRQTYEVYKAVRKVTRKPGDMAMDYAIRGKSGQSISGKNVTTDQLQADAAKFRILEGVRAYVGSHFPDIASFDLAFDLSCRQVPDVILPDEVAVGQVIVE